MSHLRNTSLTDGATTAWGYVRLSQEGREASLDEQKRSIREYARDAGLDLATTRNDGAGTSGFTEARDEYGLLREKVAAAEIDAVVVRDRARLSRDFDERLWLITTFRATGVEWHVVEAGGRIPVEDTQQAGIECLHAMMDHVKKQIEIERSKAATEQRIEDGCYHGTPPFGLRFAADKCHLEKDPDEWETLTELAGGELAGTVAAVAAEVGISTATVSRARSRGIEWYEAKLEEYGRA